MNSPVYICYDKKQRDYFMNNGLKYYVCGLNPNGNHKMFWVFMRDENFKKLIKNWKNN